MVTSLRCTFVHIVQHRGAHHASNMLSFTTTTSPERTTVIVWIWSAMARVVRRKRVNVKIKHVAVHRSVNYTNSMAGIGCVDPVIVVFHVFVFDVLVVVIVKGWVVPCVDEVGVMRRRRWRQIAKGRAVAVIVRIIDHACLHAGTRSAVEVFAKALNTVSRKDTEDFALVVVELGRGFATKDC